MNIVSCDKIISTQGSLSSCFYFLEHFMHISTDVHVHGEDSNPRLYSMMVFLVLCKLTS